MRRGTAFFAVWADRDEQRCLTRDEALARAVFDSAVHFEPWRRWRLVSFELPGLIADTRMLADHLPPFGQGLAA